MAHGSAEHKLHFKYLGSMQEHTAQQDKELGTRLRSAGVAFHKLYRRVFKIRSVSLVTKMRIYKTVVVPALIYGAAESWAPTQAQEQQLDVFNTTCLRRILGVRRGPGMMSNDRLYSITGQTPISQWLRMHRLRWLGHVARMPDSSNVKRLLFATACMQDDHAPVKRRGAPHTCPCLFNGFEPADQETGKIPHSCV